MTQTSTATTQTATLYQVESHEYPETITCANPHTCTKASHWEVSADDVPADELDAWTQVNDHPAVRITIQPND